MGKDYPRLLIIKSANPNKLESKIHKFLGKRYSRIGRLEIFKVRD
jgi:hypothetical protein